MKTTSLTLLVTAAATTLMAQPPAPSFDAVKTALGLTDAQITSLTALRTQERTSLRTLHQQMAAKHTALRQAVTAGTNATAAGQALLDIEALRKQIDTAAAGIRTQALAVLSADQKTKLASLEAAAKLRPAIGQAGALNLLTPDSGGFGGQGFGGPGFGPRGFGGGPGGPRGFRPPPAQ